MKNLNNYFLALSMFSSPIVFAQDHSQHLLQQTKTEEEDHQHSADEEIYTCPMHPEVRQNKPGNCPICHMPLVKVGAEEAKAGKNTSQISGRASVALKEGEEKLLALKYHTMQTQELGSEILSSGRALSRSRIYLQVPESDVSSVQKGARVVLESPSLGTEKELGIVTEIDSQLEPSTRTLRVLVDVKTLGAPHLLTESTVMARIELKKGEGLWVPESALVRSADKSYVFVLEDAHLVPKEVTLGVRVGDGFELIDGLSLGDKVLSQGTFLIDSESRLRGR